MPVRMLFIGRCVGQPDRDKGDNGSQQVHARVNGFGNNAHRAAYQTGYDLHRNKAAVGDDR